MAPQGTCLSLRLGTEGAQPWTRSAVVAYVALIAASLLPHIRCGSPVLACHEVPVLQTSHGPGGIYNSWVRWAGEVNTHVVANHDSAQSACYTEVTFGGAEG